MEKADFLDRVATALAQRGMTDAEILRYTEKTSALLDKLPAEELGAVLSDRVDADRFAAELLAEEKPVKKPETSAAAQRAALPVTKVPVPPAAQKPTVPAAQKAPTPAQQQTAPAGRPAQTPAPQRQTAPAPAPQKTPAAPAGRPAQTPAPQRQ
ncbi:MAG: 2-oxoglutarate dehydrogenase, E2 component, dihydrolipoamide succinyltransferase, partial [Clostridia bacterium]|nr:2-oxoglutarate dehydrogenase, E2 component, dihydrolipoamide succinyltransferase [Clostridia bacterium]